MVEVEVMDDRVEVRRRKGGGWARGAWGAVGKAWRGCCVFDAGESRSADVGKANGIVGCFNGPDAVARLKGGEVSGCVWMRRLAGLFWVPPGVRERM